MRITKAALNRRWTVSVLLGLALFAVVVTLDLQLRALSGLDTLDLQGFSQALQYDAARRAWIPLPFALRAGFALGFDYLFMVVYATAFFYSGVLTREAFAPRPSRLRRLLTLLTAVPIAGAVLDAAENSLELWMLLDGASDSMARIAFAVSNAKMAAVYVGFALLAGAILARVQERQKRKLSAL